MQKIVFKTMSLYLRKLRRYSSKRGVAGSSLGADTEFILRKTSYTCALSNRRVSGPVRLS